MENSTPNSSSNTNESPGVLSNTTQQGEVQHSSTPPSESRHNPSLPQLSDNELGRGLQIAPTPPRLQNMFRFSDLLQRLNDALLEPLPSEQGTAAVGSATDSQVSNPATGNPPHNQGTGPNPYAGCENCNRGTQRSQPIPEHCFNCNTELIDGLCPYPRCRDPPGFFLEDCWHVHLQTVLYPLPARKSTKREDRFTGAAGSGRRQRAFLYLLLGLKSITN